MTTGPRAVDPRAVDPRAVDPRAVKRPRRGFRLPPAIVAAIVTFVVLLATYLGTAAPDLTFWDAAELTTAAQTLGIPHPPGTPLWVLLGRVAAIVFVGAGPARAVTLLSVWTTASAGALGAAMATRWIGARGAVAAAVSAGAMMTVWANATEVEVYSASLLLAVAMLFSGDRAGRHDITNEQRARWRSLLVFLAALAVPLHLSALVALPAATAFAWRGAKPSARDGFIWAALAALALSVVAVLPILAARGPALNSGNATSLHALWSLLSREQYAVAGLWPRAAPMWLQVGNVFEWADWQVAFGLSPRAEPSWARTTISVLWLWLSALGLRALWRHEARVGRAMALLVISGTVGVAVWLNMKAGPSYGAGVLPASALHEVRERDYFFALGFWGWGILAGAGIANVAIRLGTRIPQIIAPAVLALAAVPLLANGPVMNRGVEPVASLPRAYGRLLLDAVPNGGILFTAGDNDSFPLWYLQQIEEYRTDVSVVVVPLLGAEWYREQLSAARAVLTRALVAPRLPIDTLLRAISARAASSRRAVRVSTMLSRADRDRIDPTVGWAFEGLVYSPADGLSAGRVALDMRTLLTARDRVPPSLLQPLPVWADGSAFHVQQLLRCTRVDRLDDPLLVSACGGA